MFRLPVCPHCKTVYSYKEVKENNKKKLIKCYHCKKEFKNNRRGLIILGLMVLVLTAAFNVFMLNNSSDIFVSVVLIAVISVIAVLIGILLIPFFIGYKKAKK